ncbi:MAG TPA: RNA polymerase sigma factor [Saprospiraceae bacterium]|nr:RNA polymerase sigma factor [Saprospiraceae bacterium]
MTIDARLLDACMKGDRKAQLRLYDQCYSYMMSICIRYCKDRQEAGSRLNLAFLKVLQHLDQFDSTGSFKGWISRITLRSIIDEFRSNQKHYEHHVYFGQPSQDMEWPDEEINHLAEHIDLDHLMALINQLNPMSRQVFNLFVLDGYGHKEIGDMLKISEGTSKWHLHEARRKLQETILKKTKTASLK